MLERQPMQIPFMAALKDAQGIDPFCRQLMKIIGKDPIRLLNEESLLSRKATVDVLLEEAMPLEYRIAALYNAHYPKLAEYPECWRMFDTARRPYYCPHMLSNVLNFETDCKSCSRQRPSNTHFQFLKLFPLLGLLEFIAIDIPKLLKWMR